MGGILATTLRLSKVDIGFIYESNPISMLHGIQKTKKRSFQRNHARHKQKWQITKCVRWVLLRVGLLCPTKIQTTQFTITHSNKKCGNTYNPIFEDYSAPNFSYFNIVSLGAQNLLAWAGEGGRRRESGLQNNCLPCFEFSAKVAGDQAAATGESKVSKPSRISRCDSGR